MTLWCKPEKRQERIFYGDISVLYLHRGVVYRDSLQSHLTVYRNHLHFTVCKLYLLIKSSAHNINNIESIRQKSKH